MSSATEPGPAAGRPGPAGEGEAPAATAQVDYLRGAGGQVDLRRAGPVMIGFCLVVLAVLVVVLTYEGVDKNDRIDRLRDHGVAVSVRVTGCIGLASGTGATISGTRCKGTFTLDGHQYNEVIGGSTIQRATGSTVAAVAERGDPGNMATAASVAATHTSASVYIAPGICVVLLFGLSGGVIRHRHRRPSTATTGANTT